MVSHMLQSIPPEAVYLIEHRDAPHTREIVLHYVGTLAAASRQQTRALTDAAKNLPRHRPKTSVPFRTRREDRERPHPDSLR